MPTPKTGFSTSFCLEWHEPTVFKPVPDQLSSNGYRLYDVSAVSVLDGSMVLVDHRVDLLTLCASYIVSNAKSDDVFDFVGKIRDFDSLNAVDAVNTVGYPDVFNQQRSPSVESRQAFIGERAAVWNTIVPPDVSDWSA